MERPRRIHCLPRRQARVRSIPSQGSSGRGRSYTLMDQLSQPETATPLISSWTVTCSSAPAPHTEWMELGNPLGPERVALRLVSGCYGYDSCICSWVTSWASCNGSRSSSARPWSWSPGSAPQSTILASTKSTLCTAGIKYPGQWFATDEARSTRRPTTVRRGQSPFRHYLSQRRTQVSAPQH